MSESRKTARPASRPLAGPRPHAGKRPQGDRARPSSAPRKPAEAVAAAAAGGPAESQAVVAERVGACVAAVVDGLLLDLVQFDVRPQGSDWRLVAAIDRLAGQGAVSLDDCVRVAQAVNAALEQDPIAACYELEVSSPGMQRPLRHAADMRRFAGLTAKLVVQAAGEARQTVVGVLVDATDPPDGVVQVRTAVSVPKKGAKVSAKKAAGIAVRVRLADVISAHLAPTLDEWNALGKRLAAESQALGRNGDDATVASWQAEEADG